MSKPPRPVPLPVQPEHIPDDLKALPQFVIWRYVWKAVLKKWDKPPLRADNGKAASSTNADTWGAFDAALQGMTQYQCDGIGIVLTEDNEIVGTDLDHCLNPITGIIEPWAQAIADRLHTYTEVSPSGTGLRLLCYARRQKHGRRKEHVEMYSWGRYLTITGHHLDGTPTTLEPRQAEFDALYVELFPEPTPTPRASPLSTNGHGPYFTDDDILEHAFAARNGFKVSRLWSGDTSEYGGDHSVADEALCCALAFWTQDPGQIDRLVRRSGLYREKWERDDYRESTIQKGIANCSTYYTPPAARTSPRPHEPHTHSPDPPDEDALPLTNEGMETVVDFPKQPLPYSDQTNAETMVRWYGDDLCYCHTLRQWFMWTGSHWLEDRIQRPMRLAKATVKRLAARAEGLDDAAAKTLMDHVKTSLSAPRLKAMMTLAESEPDIAITPEQLDSHPWLLNCRNGTIDLRTGTLRPPRRGDYLTKCLDIDYNRHATCPEWRSFLWRVMGGPRPDEAGHEEVLLERHTRAEKLVNFLQRMVGYSLTGIIAEHVLVFLYGEGGNGKTTFSETLAELFGSYYQKAPTHLLMMKPRANLGAATPELARLFGARLVMACEIGEGQRLNETQVKDLTGDDTIVARNLFEGFIEFRPTYKLWMYGNHKPLIKGTDDAIWRRPKLVPFTVQIPKEEIIDRFRETRLLPELSGILAWAVEGCLKWQQSGLEVPDVVNVATQEYRQEMDVVGQFIEERCTCLSGASVKPSTLYAEYCKWCDESHEESMKQRNFGMKLTKRGFTRDRGTGGTHLWRGIGLFVPSVE